MADCDCPDSRQKDSVPSCAESKCSPATSSQNRCMARCAQKFFLRLLLGIAIVLSSVAANAETGQSESILVKGRTGVWIAKGASLRQRSIAMAEPAHDGSGQQLSDGFLSDFAAEIRTKLRERGLEVLPQDALPHPDSIKVQVTVTKFAPGSALERWAAPGMGSTVCIARATISESLTGKIIGEILSWRDVSAGGLFSVGAKEYIPPATADSIADALADEVLD